MAFHVHGIDSSLAALDAAVDAARRSIGSCTITKSIERFRADLAAARFHLRRDNKPPLMLVVLGGTGTGKSTLVNRILGADITAASFRRTFTAGAVAIAHESSRLPDRWLDLDHHELSTAQWPARGQVDALSIARVAHDLSKHITLIDTPDLDGDQPLHHAQADRAFRWADAVLFLVTPEKYQMTELLPYYRLARRYALPTLFVMNKAEEHAVVDDYAAQLDGLASDSSQLKFAASHTGAATPAVFAIPRDDAAYEPPPVMCLDALRQALTLITLGDVAIRHTGDAHRLSDLLDRFADQILSPLQQNRCGVDQIIASLRAMTAPSADVDVNPVMVQLRRRLQQRSVLYLMGPGRMFDRVRQVPGLLARLPRSAWDLMRHGQLGRNGGRDLPPELEARTLDFRGTLTDQFRIVQTRIDDILRSNPTIAPWLDDPTNSGFAGINFDPEQAGQIADQELANLREWLEKKWNATPRDTAVLTRLIKHLPGGEKLTQWSEAAPYLLAAVVATHHAFFGPVDLMVIGGFSLATWLTERLSNEVASRTRDTNRAIARRFAELAQSQINRVCQWLETRVPSRQVLRDLQRRADELNQMISTVE